MKVTTHKAYVAFLDILGFKDIVNNKQTDELEVTFIHDIWTTIEGCRKRAKLQESSFDYIDDSLEFLSISDSILVWSGDDSVSSFTNLVITVRLLLLSFMYNGIPLRGGISRGPISVMETSNHKVAFGKSIVDAYNIEKDQEWSGCIISKNCIPREEYLNDLSNLPFITKYKVPRKHGKINGFDYAVNWIWHDNPYSWEINENSIGVSFAANGKKTDDWSVKRKIENTVDFYRFVKKCNE